MAQGNKGSISSREGQGGRVSEGGFSEGSAGTAVEAHLGSGASKSQSRAGKSGDKSD